MISFSTYPRRPVRRAALGALCFLSLSTALSLAAPPKAAPERNRGEGPFPRLILRAVTIVNGEGAPAQGPVDLLIEGDRIRQIVALGGPGTTIDETKRPVGDEHTRVLDLAGYYVLPGFIDMHGHLGGEGQGVPAEYVLKLWLAHGVTTVREPGSFNGLEWTLDHARRSEALAIDAPRIIPYAGFGLGRDKPITTPDEAREWIRAIAEQGARGVKFFGAAPEIMSAALDELKRLGLRSATHHAQLNVARWNVLDSARAGLTTMEHWYGLPEALFEDRTVQNYPADYNYGNEAYRFGEAGRLWAQAAAPASRRWNSVRDELIALDFTIDPTFTIYEANRDLMREMNADWQREYTHPKLWAFFQPSRDAHGSYWYDWTTADEIAWRDNFRRWMTFINDYKNHGGRVTTGSDSGFIFKVYGFGYIRELELLQEAGFHPLEVIRAATLNGAEALGIAALTGSIAVGKKADLVVVDGNPLANFKILYGTGHFQLGADGKPERHHGLRYTIKDGVVYDTEELLGDVRRIVSEATAAP